MQELSLLASISTANTSIRLVESHSLTCNYVTINRQQLVQLF